MGVNWGKVSDMFNDPDAWEDMLEQIREALGTEEYTETGYEEYIGPELKKRIVSALLLAQAHPKLALIPLVEDILLINSDWYAINTIDFEEYMQLLDTFLQYLSKYKGVNREDAVQATITALAGAGLLSENILDILLKLIGED